MAKKLNHHSAPIYERCVDFINDNPVPFYCPGHKGGRTLSYDFKQKVIDIDLNNLRDTDTLHCPTGCILEAEHLLADAYGVDKSFILVGGSSAGNITSIMATIKPGEKIFVQRNAHKSVISGIIISGAIPIWLNPEIDPIFGIVHGLHVNQIRSAIINNPDTKVLFLVSPTYYGTVPDLAAIIDICHQNDIIVIADEAHGAHFSFSPLLPNSAEALGADIIVQSTHKTLSALSQGAVLHLQTRQISEAQVRSVLQLTQTTSPNFAIMASIDLARRQMVLEGSDLLKNLLSISNYARNNLNKIPSIKVLSKEDGFGYGSGFLDLDETKILVNTQELGLTGYEVLALLNDVFNIQPELAGPNHVLFIMTIGNTKKDVNSLIKAFKKLSSSYAKKNNLCDYKFYYPNFISDVVITPRESFYTPSEYIPFHESVGRICSEIITPYPPGIPLIMPGEKISIDVYNFLQKLKIEKSPITSNDGSLDTIKVVA